MLTRHGCRSAAQRVGHTQGFAHVRALFASNGGAAVAWSVQAVSEGEPRSDFTAQLARETSAGRFGPARRLDSAPAAGTGTYVNYAGVAAAPLADGRVALAWTDYVGAGSPFAPPISTAMGRSPHPRSWRRPTATPSSPGWPAHRPADWSRCGWPERAGANPGTGEPRHGLYASTRPPAAIAFGAPEQLIDARRTAARSSSTPSATTPWRPGAPSVDPSPSPHALPGSGAWLLLSMYLSGAMTARRPRFRFRGPEQRRSP